MINSNPSKKEFKVHFVGYSYHYEKWIKDKEVKLVEEDEKEDKQGNEGKEKGEMVNEK